MNILRLVMPYVFVMFAVLLSLSGPVAAQQRPPAEAVAKTVKQVPAASASVEIEVLKAQLGTMQSFTDRLVTTVFWSLGAVVVVASLLVGFGWFTSIRLHERDISAIRTELTGVFSSQLAAIRVELEKLVQDQISDLTTSSSVAAKSAVSTETEPIKHDIKILRESIKRVSKELAYMKFQSTAWYWEGQGVKGNEITQYIEILRLAAADNDASKISITLKKLEALLRNGTEIFISKVSDITVLIDSLSPEHAIQTAALREALKTAKTY